MTSAEYRSAVLEIVGPLLKRQVMSSLTAVAPWLSITGVNQIFSFFIGLVIDFVLKTGVFLSLVVYADFRAAKEETEWTNAINEYVKDKNPQSKQKAINAFDKFSKLV